MDNQHREIDGYRELNQQEIDVMNMIKARIDLLRTVIENARDDMSADPRCAALAITNLEQCSMWACRAIAKPTSG